MRMLTVRGLDEETTRALKKDAVRKGVSVNSLVVRIIRESFGLDKPERRSFDDLDHLAGTWSEKEYREFERDTGEFEAVDRKLWR